MNSLEDSFLTALIARLDPPADVGIAIAGSHARGESNEYSDLDLDIFVNQLPEETYSFRLFNGRLVSQKYILLADEYVSMTRPEKAVWAVPGLRQMQIVQDESGQIAKLKQTALDFNWAVLQQAADQYAVDDLMKCAEEAHKIISGLKQQHESKVMYASWGMFKELSFSVLIQAGLLIDSENRAFDIIQKHLGTDHPWTRVFRLSFGMDLGDMHIPAYQTRGQAALDLYVQTAVLFKEIIHGDDHREMIDHTLQLIANYKEGPTHE
jgi:hypothetical protein